MSKSLPALACAPKEIIMADFMLLIRRELRYRRELLHRYEKWIRTAPPGRIGVRRRHNGTVQSYHHYTEAGTGRERRRVLREEDAELAEQLTLKCYANACIVSLKKSIRLAERFLDQQAAFAPEKLEQKLGRGYDGIRLKLQELVPSPADDAWAGIPERQNTSFPERMRYQAAGGMYRSKSEMIIATQLARFELPFKYEPSIELGSFHFCPDFVVRNPLDGELVYWEHLGMLGNEAYHRSTERKLDMYHVNGIRPGDNLILTSDGDHAPLPALKIERVIRAHFT